MKNKSKKSRLNFLLKTNNPQNIFSNKILQKIEFHMKNEFEVHVKIVQAFVNFRLASVDNEQNRWWRENKTYGK